MARMIQIWFCYSRCKDPWCLSVTQTVAQAPQQDAIQDVVFSFSLTSIIYHQFSGNRSQVSCCSVLFLVLLSGILTHFNFTFPSWFSQCLFLLKKPAKLRALFCLFITRCANLYFIIFYNIFGHVTDKSIKSLLRI